MDQVIIEQITQYFRGLANVTGDIATALEDIDYIESPTTGMKIAPDDAVDFDEISTNLDTIKVTIDELHTLINEHTT